MAKKKEDIDPKQKNMVRKNIPVFLPNMGDEECKAVTEVLKSQWTGLGPKTDQFEKDFSIYLGSTPEHPVYSVAVNSATAGLHLALRAAEIKPGDEVITTPVTFASTVEAILYNRAIPVFADTEYGTLNISPEDVRRKITPKTRAILPVHYGGHPVDLEALEQIAKEHNLIIIEDCAHAAGASYKGRKIGNSNRSEPEREPSNSKRVQDKNLCIFSFHSVKNISCGDGGMITTTDKETADRLKQMRWMGINKDTYARSDGKYKWDYSIDEQGWKYHMNDITAAIGIEQLKKLDKMNARRRTICALYDREFSKLKIEGLPIDIPEMKPWPMTESARHNYVLKISKDVKEDMGEYREELIAFLGERGISVGVHYRPIYLHPRYAIYDKQDTPIAQEVWTKILTLPVFPDMTDMEAYYVVKSVEDFFKKKKN